MIELCILFYQEKLNKILNPISKLDRSFEFTKRRTILTESFE